MVGRRTATIFVFALLAGCTTRFAHHEVANPAVSLNMRGLVVHAPSGTGWLVTKKEQDAVVFIKHSSSADARPDEFPYLITAGVINLSADALRATGSDDLIIQVRRFLSERMNNPRQELVQLDIAPAVLDSARCAEYRASQVDRYYPERTDPRYQFVHHGFLCRHPRTDMWIVQAFYFEQHLRQWQAPEQRASVLEAEVFLTSLRFVALP